MNRSRFRRSVYYLAAAAVAVVATVLTPLQAHAAGPRPLFQLPFPCGQTWQASTYAGHWPNDNSIDLRKYDDTGTNVSRGEPVLASAAGTVAQVGTDGDG